METILPVVILTGVSGAGKSSALRVFEDMGFFCVDGLPPAMLSKLATLYSNQSATRSKGLALGLDIRQRDFLADWEVAMSDLNKAGFSPQVIYFKASRAELTRRYHETRRPHPLESENLSLEMALEEEEQLLHPIYSAASLVMDTTTFSIHDLRRTLQEKWNFISDSSCGLRIHVLSFGFKHAAPDEADLLFDLRFLPNPYFDKELKSFSGQDKRVAEYVLESPAGKEFSDKLLDFLEFLVPRYAEEGRYRLTIALGCTGGRHRSVATAEMVHKRLKELNYSVTLEHRHIGRT